MTKLEMIYLDAIEKTKAEVYYAGNKTKLIDKEALAQRSAEITHELLIKFAESQGNDEKTAKALVKEYINKVIKL